jgi:hypothetical protein
LRKVNLIGIISYLCITLMTILSTYFNISGSNSPEIVKKGDYQ